MEWIKCSDRLPPKETNIILYDGNEVFCGDWCEGQNKKICWGIQACDEFCYGNYDKQEITHWMPLPKPPET